MIVWLGDASDLILKYSTISKSQLLIKNEPAGNTSISCNNKINSLDLFIWLCKKRMIHFKLLKSFLFSGYNFLWMNFLGQNTINNIFVVIFLLTRLSDLFYKCVKFIFSFEFFISEFPSQNVAIIEFSCFLSFSIEFYSE